MAGEFVQVGRHHFNMAHVTHVQDDGKQLTIDLANGNHVVLTNKDEIVSARKDLGIEGDDSTQYQPDR